MLNSARTSPAIGPGGPQMMPSRSTLLSPLSEPSISVTRRLPSPPSQHWHTPWLCPQPVCLVHLHPGFPTPTQALILEVVPPPPPCICLPLDSRVSAEPFFQFLFLVFKQRTVQSYLLPPCWSYDVGMGWNQQVCFL